MRHQGAAAGGLPNAGRPGASATLVQGGTPRTLQEIVSE